MSVVGAVLLAIAAVTYGRVATSHIPAPAWLWQNPQPQGNRINAMSFATTDIGWAAGMSGVVLNTTDGGAHWTFQGNGGPNDPGVYRDWYGTSFADISTGWIAGSRGTIKKTTNGGSAWSTATISPATSGTFRGVASLNETSVIAVGTLDSGSPVIRYTTDGTTWVPGATSVASNLYSVAFPAPTLAWAVGANGTMIKSTNGGQSWTSIPPLTSQSLNSVAFAKGSAIGYAVGNAAASSWTILKTTDGTNWAPLTITGTAQSLYSVACDPTGAHVTVVGASGYTYRSDDGGKTWANETPSGSGALTWRAVAMPELTRVNVAGDRGIMPYSRDSGSHWLSDRQKSSATLNDTWFNTASAGWAVGDGGLLMRTTNGGLNWSGRNVGTSANLLGVTFPGTQVQVGWVAGAGGKLFKTADGGSTWTPQTSGTSAAINDIAFFDTSNGVAVADGGTVLSTANGGSTWTALNSRTTQNLYGISFGADAKHAYAVGANGTLLYTADLNKGAGATWTALASGVSVALRGVSAGDNNHVIAVGDGGTALRTANATTWTNVSQAVGTTEQLLDVHMFDNNRAWIGGAHGFAAHTANSGTAWAKQDPGFPRISQDDPVAVNAVWFASATAGVAVGSNGEIRYTSDGGATWGYAAYGTVSNLSGLTAIGQKTAWAVGDAGAVINTFDGGQTWYQQSSGAAQNLNDIKMVSTLTGWAVGNAGTIRYTTNGGWGWASQTTSVTTAFDAIDATGTSAIAVGAGGQIIRTTNSGASWAAAASVPTTMTLYDVAMSNATTAWAVAGGTGPSTAARIMHTTDGGATWSAEVTGTADLRAVTFRPDGLSGWAVGVDGTILHTADAGVHWAPQSSNTSAALLDVSFVSDTTGWVAGAGGTSLITTNGGATWQSMDAGTDSLDLNALSMSDTYAGWVVGDGGTVLSARDYTLPITSLTTVPSAPDGDDQWFVTTPEIQLTPDKAATTYYSWDSASGPFSVYGGPIKPAPGASALYYYSADTGGNKEPVQSATFKVDTVAPTTASGLGLASAAGTSTASLSWNASTDAGSGTSLYLVYVNGSYWTSSAAPNVMLTGLAPYGTYSVFVVARDVAGNLSAPSNTISFTTVGSATDALGTLLHVSPAAPNGLNGWYSSVPTFTLTSLPTTASAYICYSFDTTSVPSSVTTYTYNYGSTSPTAGPYAVAIGTHALWYWSVEQNSVRPVQYFETTISVDPIIPDAPVSFAAAAASDSAVHLSWAAPVDTTNSGIDHYDVLQGDSPDSATVLASVATDTLAYDVVGLAPVTGYTFWIRTVSVAGNVSTPVSASATTLPAPKPSPPDAVYARGTDGQTIYVDWTPSKDAQMPTTYVVWRDGTPVASISDPGVFSYVDTGLSAESAHRYSVTTTDPRGSSETSTSWTATTTVPSRVLGVAAAPSSVTASGAVLLTWQPSSDPTVNRYVVYRSRVSMAELATQAGSPSLFTTITPLPIATPFWEDSGLQPGVVYYYKVAAIDAAGHLGRMSAEIMSKSSEVQNPANDPHIAPGPGTATCAACHRVHDAGSENLTVTSHEPTPSTYATPQVAAGGSWDHQRLCTSCHNGVGGTDVTTALADPLTAPATGSRHGIVTATGTSGSSLLCGSCHGAHWRSPDKPVAVNGVTNGSAVCYQCHGAGSPLVAGDTRFFENSVHNKIAAPTQTGIKCDNCHTPMSSTNPQLLKYENYQLCVQCHDGTGDAVAAPDILSLLDASTDPTSRHPLSSADQQARGSRISCANCHNSMRVTTDNPLADPDDPYATQWTGGANAFCLRCHDGNYPTSSQTEPFVASPLGAGGDPLSTDIASAYRTNVHGAGVATDGQAHLRPEMGYGVGENVPCTACHQQHGTTNPYMLKQSVSSRSGGVTRNGLLVARTPGGGADFRFFCSSCHYLTPEIHASLVPTSAADLSVFPTDCTGSGCHQHTMAAHGPGTTVTDTTF